VFTLKIIMCYRLVDMVATDKTLQDEEFYSEYLKWKDSDSPSAGKEKMMPCSPEKGQKRKRKRLLFKPKSKESGNTDSLPFLIKHGKVEIVDKVLIKHDKAKMVDKVIIKSVKEEMVDDNNNNNNSPNELSWANITEGKKIHVLDDARICKAGLGDRDNTINKITTSIKIYNKMPDMNTIHCQANALMSLKGIQGIPYLYGIITSEEPAAIIMSYHPGRTLRDYIEGGDTLMSLMAFSDICKILEKLHSRCWAHYDLKSSNIHVNIDDKGRVRATIIDFTCISPVQINPYSTFENLPSHLPEDVQNQQCEGDLVDRYSLCYMANEICGKMVDAAETKTLRRAVKRGLAARTIPHARKRLGPVALARMVNTLVGRNTHLSWKFDLDE